MARAAKARAARAGKLARSGSTGWKWWQGMLGGMLLMLSPGAAMLLLALSAPVLLVMIADSTPRRVVTRTVRTEWELAEDPAPQSKGNGAAR